MRERFGEGTIRHVDDVLVNWIDQQQQAERRDDFPDDPVHHPFVKHFTLPTLFTGNFCLWHEKPPVSLDLFMAPYGPLSAASLVAPSVNRALGQARPRPCLER